MSDNIIKKIEKIVNIKKIVKDVTIKRVEKDVRLLVRSSVGAKGDKGDKGLTGADSDVEGPEGPQGIQGIEGPQGDQGITGLQGIQGDQGIVGPTGAIGLTGDTGDQGIQGDTGPQGDDGLDGSDGTGVTIAGSDTVANILLKVGSVGEMWLATDSGVGFDAGDGYVWNGSGWDNVGPIRGPKGDDGDDGIQGEIGLQGDDGNRISEPVNQVAHGFLELDPVKRVSGSWVKAIADTPVNADIDGVVEFIDTDNFNVVFEGRIDTTVFTDGADIYLDTLSYTLTEVEPNYQEGNVKQYVGTSDGTALFVKIDVGYEQNAFPDLPLSNDDIYYRFTRTGIASKDDYLFPELITKEDFDGITSGTSVINRNVGNNLIIDSIVDTFDYNGSNYIWTTPYLGGTNLLANRKGTPSVVIGSDLVVPSYAVFNGTTSSIEYPSFNITNNLMVEAKIISLNTQAGTVGVIAGKYTSSSRSWYMAMRLSGVMRVYMSQSGGFSQQKIYETVNTISAGDKVAFSFENNAVGDDLKIFINDIQQSVTKPTDDAMSQIYSSSTKVYLGRSAQDNDYFNGSLGYVKIYNNNVLETNFNPSVYGDLLDHSVNNHPTTNTDVTLLPIPSAVPSYAVFDGLSNLDFGNPAELQITNDLTVEVGLRAYVAGTDQSLVGKVSSAYGWDFRLRSNSQLDGYVVGTSDFRRALSDLTTPQDVDLTYSFSSGAQAMKFDGLGTPFTDTGTITGAYTDAGTLVIGNRSSDLGTPLNGELLYVRIYDGATLALDFNPSVYGDLLDHSVYAHPVTNTGVTLLPIPAPVPSYAVFDGSSYLDFGNPAELQITDNLIVEAGVRSHTILQGVAAFAIASYREGAGNDGWELSIRNNTGSVGGCQLTATILGAFAVGEWMNTYTDVALGADNTVRAEFVSNSKALFEFGGSPVSTSLGSVAIASIWTGNANLRLGARYNGTSLDSFLVGDIDYIRIYDGATLVLDFNPSVYGDLLDHSIYNHPATNTGVTLLPI